MALTWPFGDLMPFRYRALLVDPPWQMTMWSDKGRDRCPDGLIPGSRPESFVARHYQTMTMAQLLELPVNHLAAPDCALFMWAIDPMLPEAIDLGRRWGFEYKTVAFYWAKLRRVQSRRGEAFKDTAERMFPMGTGYWTRANPEPCLLFTRGNPKRLSAGVRKLIVSPRREHSRKPDEAHARIQRLCEGPYGELFAREPRDGWEIWGDQTSHFLEEAA
jgi:N6-adenosine-specific RNA methylase IME4